MSPLAKRPKKPAVSLSKVPPVKELTEQLGFQHASLKDTTSFLDATHAWRKSSTTESGQSATQLLQWNLTEVQLDLHTEAERFLGSDGNAERFWSPTRSWIHDANDLQYPSDRARIVELLKQLFWRQNRYAFNNLRYGPKATESRDGSLDTTSSTPAQFQHTTLPSATPPQVQQYNAASTSKEQFVPLEQLAARDSSTHPAPQHLGSCGTFSTQERDIFEIPDDSGDDHGCQTSSKLQPVSKHQRHEQTVDERINNKKKKRKLAFQSPVRRTGRKRVPRVAYSPIPDEEFERLLDNHTEDKDPDEHQAQAKEPHELVSRGVIGLCNAFIQPQETEYSSANPTTNLTTQFSGPLGHLHNEHRSGTPGWVSVSGNPFKAPTAPMTSPEQPRNGSVDATGQPPRAPRYNKICLVNSTSLRPLHHHCFTSQTTSTAPFNPHPSVNATLSSPTSSTRFPPPSSSGRLDREIMDNRATLSETESTHSVYLPSQTPTDQSSGGHEHFPSTRSSFAAQPPESLYSGHGGAANTIGQDLPQSHTLDTLSANEFGQSTMKEPPMTSLNSLPEQPNSVGSDGRSTWGTQDNSSHYDHFSFGPQPIEMHNQRPQISESPGPNSSTSVVTQRMPTLKPAISEPKVSIGEHTTSEPEPTIPELQSTVQEPPTLKSRPKTQIPLWIITREPRYTEERWDDGKFQGTALPIFLEGISQVTQRSHIEKIKLTLRTPISDTKITVFKDAEDSWAAAKDTFVDRLKEAKKNARLSRGAEAPSYQILVEPFFEQGVEMNGSVDDDDVEFDF